MPAVNDYTVTVFGATGKTGRHVAELATGRGWTVRSAGRRPAAHGRTVPFDWDDETTWVPAAAGAQAAYVLIPFNHPGAPERTPDLLRAVAGAGVERVVLLSSLDVDSADADSPLCVSERTLAELPVASAVLRPTWFLDNFTLGSFAGMTRAGEIRLPCGEGRIPFVAAVDIAAVAVAAMGPDAATGPLPITGPESVTHHEVAAALTEATGRQVSYTPVTADEFVDLMCARGFSEDYGRFLADALADVATGALRIPVHDTVPRLTGRPALDVTEFARRFAA